MKLKQLAIFEIILNFIINLLFSPFGLILGLLNTISWPFSWIMEWRVYLTSWLGNKLLKSSDEVKNGTIQNRDFINTKSATWAYFKLKAEQQNRN